MSEKTEAMSEDITCFFVTPIGAEGSDIRKRSDLVYDYIVKPAADELGLVGLRADEMNNPGQITTQVMEQVLRSKLVVADLTGHNPNVFYEIAVRHGTAKPIVLIADKETALPFDVITMRTITFDYRDLRSADECKLSIVEHAKTALDSGVIETPISAAFNMIEAQTGTSQEQLMAQILQRLEALTRDQREVASTVGSLVQERRRVTLTADSSLPQHSGYQSGISLVNTTVPDTIGIPRVLGGVYSIDTKIGTIVPKTDDGADSNVSGAN